MAGKNDEAFRSIGEVAESLDLPPHVLRFWETRFEELKPIKRAGGRRFYRARDVELLKTLRRLLYGQGYTIKGVQRILREHGVGAVIEAVELGRPLGPAAPEPPPRRSEPPDLDRTVEAPPTPAVIVTRPAAGLPALIEAPLLTEGLSAEDVSRLRLALADLAECRRLLRLGKEG